MAKFIELELENGVNTYFNIDRIDYVFQQSNKGTAVIVVGNEYNYTKEQYMTVINSINAIVKS